MPIEDPTFDVDAFMSQTIDEPLETERTLCPAGEYRMYIDEVTRDSISIHHFTYKRGPNEGQEGVMYTLAVPCIIDDPAVAAAMEQSQITVFKRVRLDIEQGRLETGKNRNVDLGQLCEAVGLNGKEWMPNQLSGLGPFMGKVEHREGKRKDGSDFKTAEVTRVVRLR